MSYNIHYGIGMDGKKDLSRIAQIINNSGPGIIGLQEIGDAAMAEELASLTNMHFVFGPSKKSTSEYGDAVLCKYPFKYVGNTSIPSASSSRYQAMCVDIDLSELYGETCSVRLINTHFDWLETLASQVSRKAAVEVIEQVFFKHNMKQPALLTGDINATPSSDPLRLLYEKGWLNESLDKKLLTEPSLNPDKQIDYVLVRPSSAWQVVEVEVIHDSMASDHLPVVMTLKLVVELLKTKQYTQ
ncbi:endonuclease/exonuclease/phosphatase family protein [Carboxylicivirga sp. N1Y90]|uniref:endonuclease/exonuclease/phosphatase family protein n=1 Tax=Carboxylicivirga fragile TaxID=3417571 RepID=UPI003D355338|nr:endonuclease/exonuclease/phosphatase family protein [Marinilabiliaceae bacterium N1Y90]